MNTRTLTLALVALSGSLFGGCVVHEQTKVYDPQPVYVEQPSVIVVHRDPPPVRVEVVPVRPAPTYVWVGGYWAAQGGEWVWMRGNWVAPPRAGAIWVEPRYEHHGSDVHFTSGHWNYGPPQPVVVAPQPVVVPPPRVVEPAPVVVAQPGVVVVHRAVPAVIVERVPARPAPNYVWVKGYWAARGDNWVWVKGNWMAPPHAGAMWVEPRYEHHGADVQFSLGYWK